MGNALASWVAFIVGHGTKGVAAAAYHTERCCVWVTIPRCCSGNCRQTRLHLAELMVAVGGMGGLPVTDGSWPPPGSAVRQRALFLKPPTHHRIYLSKDNPDFLAFESLSRANSRKKVDIVIFMIVLDDGSATSEQDLQAAGLAERRHVGDVVFNADQVTRELPVDGCQQRQCQSGQCGEGIGCRRLNG